MRYNSHYTGVDDSEPVKHWKYIKKYRKNGRWQYIYKNPDAYDRGVTTTQNVTTKYYNSNTLFDTTTKSTTLPSGDVTISKGRGKISQAIDKGRDWIDKKMHGQLTKYDAYDHNATSKKKVTTKYQDSNDLFSSTVTRTDAMSGNTNVVKKRGKIDRAINRGKAYVNAFLKDHNILKTKTTLITKK